MLTEKFRPKHNGTILSLQNCKQVGEEKESAEEWMGHLRVKANECEYKERARMLKEQLINGIGDNDMMAKIMKNSIMIKKTTEITREQALNWTKGLEVQRV